MRRQKTESRRQKNGLLFLLSLSFYLLPFPHILAVAQTTDPGKSEADQILKLCREQLQQQQYEAAIQSCQEAAESLRQRGNRNGKARGITNLGIAYLNQSQPEKAIGYFQQSLPMFQAEKDRSGEAIVLGNLGKAYRNLSQNEQAISY
jgi:tetratricopeptide (TPR) repeat protein